MARHFLVVSILSDGITEDRIAEYGGTEGASYLNSLAYPGLRAHVDDEEDVFVLDDSTPPRFWHAAEFFMEVDIHLFWTEDEV